MKKSRKEFKENFNSETKEFTRADIADACSEVMENEPFSTLIAESPIKVLELGIFVTQMLHKLFDAESEDDE